MEKINSRQGASLIYDVLDASGFYRSPVAKEDRSRMNIPFTLRGREPGRGVPAAAKQRGLIQLKGHRSVGGMRASIYNAMPIEGVHALVEFMREFERKEQWLNTSASSPSTRSRTPG